MRIHDAIEQLVHGRKVARSFWTVGTHLFLDSAHPGFPRVAVGENPPVDYTPSVQDLLAGDWVVVHHIVINVNDAEGS